MPNGATTASDPRLLTKSLFLAGLQCQKRLYLRVQENTPKAELGLADQYLLDQGNEITELARTCFPGGAIVGLRSEEAVDLTLKLIEDPGTSVIFEGAIIADDILIRADVLERIGPKDWRLIEVKSATKLKEEHLPDIAIQAYALERAGVHVASTCMMLLNREYVYPGGICDVHSLFTIVDVSKAVEEFLQTIGAKLAEQRATLMLPHVPEVPPGKQCTAPRECEFFALCNPKVAEDHVSLLPRLSGKKAALLDGLGVTSLHQVPDEFDLTEVQRRMVGSVKSGRPYISQELREVLATLKWPLLYMDFETWSPAIPVLHGTRAYDSVPFQWSIHVEHQPDGDLRHLEFLADSEGDPRSLFLESLLQVVESHSGSIVVYSSFEATQLRTLSTSLPGSAERIERIYPRIWDLLATVRDHVYYPGFRGSFSIKKVLPAMRPDMRYDHLPIRDGVTAGAAYDRIRKTDVATERSSLRAGLLAYCCQDTLAMYALVRSLRESFEGRHEGARGSS